MNNGAVDSGTGLLVNVCMPSVGLPPGSGIAESSDTPVFGFSHYCQFSKVVVPIKTCIGTMRCPGTPHPPDMWNGEVRGFPFCFVLLRADLVSVQWVLTAVLICVSLSTDGGDHHVTHTWAIGRAFLGKEETLPL